MRLGLVGATGLVGSAFQSLLGSRAMPIDELRLFASQASAGRQASFGGRSHELRRLEAGCFDDLDLVFFSAGAEVSRTWAPRAVAAGAHAIDNSSAFRMSPEHPLVVPEVNGELLRALDRPAIIANPNCSTIQLVVALAPLARDFGLRRVQVATYQAVSGAGRAARAELESQTSSLLDGGGAGRAPEAFPHPIAFNCLPHIGPFNGGGYCDEETKIMRETRKILALPELAISAFTVRVPTLNGHGEAVWVSLAERPSERQVLDTLDRAEGLELVRQERPESYPHVRQASGRLPVYVGRVHRDASDPRTWLMWVVADNVLKGAAYNALQIAERILSPAGRGAAPRPESLPIASGPERNSNSDSLNRMDWRP